MSIDWAAFRRGFKDGLGFGALWRWLARQLQEKA